MFVMFVAALHMIPLFVVAFLNPRISALNITAVVMCVIALFLGNIDYLIWDLLAIALAYFIAKAIINDDQESSVPVTSKEPYPEVLLPDENEISNAKSEKSSLSLKSAVIYLFWVSVFVHIVHFYFIYPAISLDENIFKNVLFEKVLMALSAPVFAIVFSLIIWSVQFVFSLASDGERPRLSNLIWGWVGFVMVFATTFPHGKYLFMDDNRLAVAETRPSPIKNPPSVTHKQITRTDQGSSQGTSTPQLPTYVLRPSSTAVPTSRRPIHGCTENSTMTNTDYVVCRMRPAHIATWNDDLALAQLRLRDYGYYRYEPSGVMDNNTTVAITKFQLDRGLVQNGQLDHEMRRLLHIQ